MEGFIITTSKGEFIKSPKVYTHLGIAKAARRVLFGYTIRYRLAKLYDLNVDDEQLNDAVDDKLMVMYPIIKVGLDVMSVERVEE